MRVRTGLERLLDDEARLVVGRRIGLICNPTSVDAELRHAADLLLARGDVKLDVLFGPEHGVRGEAQDMDAVEAGRDPITGLRCHSLYGADVGSLEPTDAMLEGLDALVFDIQDIGTRYYTFVWTMALAMRACARRGIDMIVLDRPNPIGGTQVEGGLVAPGFDSFVGLYPVAVRHGMTAGEIARFVNDACGIGCALTVVAMQGWRRDMYFRETRLPWVLPSPNMPTVETALVYPGMCLVEGTEISEGRGCTRPFEIFGAPYIDGVRLAEELSGLPGVRLRPLVFRPTFHKHAGKGCGGLQIHVYARGEFLPFKTGVGVLRAIKKLWPEHFRWRDKPYEFVTTIPAIDLLCGSAEVRQGIESGAALDDIAATWRKPEAEFVEHRRPYLLY